MKFLANQAQIVVILTCIFLIVTAFVLFLVLLVILILLSVLLFVAGLPATGCAAESLLTGTRLGRSSFVAVATELERLELELPIAGIGGADNATTTAAGIVFGEPEVVKLVVVVVFGGQRFLELGVDRTALSATAST